MNESEKEEKCHLAEVMGDFIQKSIEQYVKRRHELSLGERYFIEDHLRECSFCFKKFKKLVRDSKANPKLIFEILTPRFRSLSA